MNYKGILTEKGKNLSGSDALLYALWSVLCDEKEKEEFIEWFYSGNWLKEM